VRFDLRVSVSEEMSRDELIVVVRRQAGQPAAQAGQLAAEDRQITGRAG
jgi:hypothetical protein